MNGEIPILKKRRLLESLDEEDLKSIEVVIKRKDVPPTNKLKQLIRNLGDFASLKVHFENEGEHPIFERDDVLVNSVEESIEVITAEFTRKCMRKFFNPNPESEGTVNFKRTSENKKSNRDLGDYRLSDPNFPVPPEADEYNCSNPDKDRYSPESKCSTRSVSGSPERDRRNALRRYKKYHEADYGRTKSPQPSCSRTQKRESASPNSTERRLRSRSKSRSPSLRPGEYRPRRSISRSLRHKSKSRSRSPSRRARPARRRSKSHSRRLKPGEYIPRKRSRSPPLRPGEYRPSKHKELDENFEAHPNPYNYSFYNKIGYGRILTQPFLPRFPTRPIFRYAQMLVPQVQFVPYAAVPPVRAPYVRPPKIYNNKNYPNLMKAPASSSTDQGNTATKNDEETNESVRRVEFVKPILI